MFFSRTSVWGERARSAKYGGERGGLGHSSLGESDGRHFVSARSVSGSVVMLHAAGDGRRAVQTHEC